MPTPLRALMVEDSENDALLIHGALERGGFSVTADRVQTAGAMRNALAEKKWDIVLCDYSMPAFDALAALRLLRSSGHDLPFIIISGTIGEDVAVEALKLGADDYLLKHNLARLVPAVKHSLQEAETRRLHKIATQAQYESEQRLKLALTASEMGVWEWDLQNNTVFWSEECFKLAHLNHFEGTFEAFARMVHPDDIGEIRRAASLAVERRSIFEVEFRVRLENGAVRWLSNFARPSYDSSGKPLRMVGTVQDITRRKEAEQAAREQEQSFRAILETTQEAFWLVDKQGRLLDVNQSACRIIGLTRDELLKMSIHEIDADKSETEIVTNLERVAQLGSAQFERRHRRNNGEVIFVEVSISYLPAQGGRLFCFFRDITDRKQTEENLRRSEHQLRALSARLEQLREEERTYISREIHDELGQMLTGIKMDLRWLEEKVGAQPSPETNGWLDRIVEASALVDETIVSVQRIVAELRPSVLDKLGLGTALKFEAKRFSERTAIQCAVAIPTNGADPDAKTATALFRIFQEALTNVARHASASRIQAVLETEAGSWHLEIIDNGRGIANDALNAANSLGILGMKERAASLGGVVEIRRGTQSGTIVDVRMPLQPIAEQKEGVWSEYS